MKKHMTRVLLEFVRKMGGAGDSPAPVGDTPTGRSGEASSKSPAWLVRVRLAVPSGGSPDGTGRWPVLPRKEFPCILLLLMVAMAVADCASAPSRFYTLNSTATAVGAPAADYAVAVGPVSIPAEVDRPQFTIQAAPNRIAIVEFDRWAGPLNNNIARVVAGDLAVLPGTPRVAAAPLANFDPAYRVTIDIQRFDSVRGETLKKGGAMTNGAVLIEAVWVVQKVAGGVARSGRTVAREPAQGGGFDALTAAHSRALAKVSGDIASAIRKEAAGRP